MPSESEDELSQDSDFDDSGFEESTEDNQAKASAPIRNQPFDEALDVSQSMDQSMDQSAQNVNMKREKMLSNQQFDEALDVSQSVDLQSPEMRKINNKQDPNSNKGDSPADNKNPGSANKLDNKPFDEFVDFDGESSGSSVDTNASPKNAASAAMQNHATQQQMKATEAALTQEPQQQRPNLAHITPHAVTNNLNSPNANSNDGESDDGSGSDSESSSESEEGEQSTPALNIEGAYDPKDFANLDVSPDISELFAYIQRYKPHEVDLETSLKCFIPDYIPAVGEMDSFVKVPRPDGKADDLGLKVLDEPTATQSDATVLELRLRAISKKAHGSVHVKSIENAAKNPREIDRWINSIAELHRSKPMPQVHYSKSMPDVEMLMDVWPEEFEELLTREKVPLPDPNLDLTMEEYVKVLCAILDIPVYEGKLVESLHLLFTTYMEFQANAHFMPNAGAGGDEAQAKYGDDADEDFGSFDNYGGAKVEYK